MPSYIVNVARYTSLLTGIGYGWYHRRTLQTAYDAHKDRHAIHERERLIEKARSAWREREKQKVQREGKKGGKDGVITDPEDPRFDLEKLLGKWEAEAN